MQKGLIGIVMIAVLMMIFPLVLTATHSLQTDNHTDAALALGGTPPVGTCVLTQDLWGDKTASVISATGNKPEALTITSYTPATHTLTVGGVTTSTTAAVVFEIDGLTDYTGMGPLVGMTPLLLWIAVLAMVIGGTWMAFKNR